MDSFPLWHRRYAKYVADGAVELKLSLLKETDKAKWEKIDIDRLQS